MNNLWKKILKPKTWIANILLLLFTILFFSLGFLDYLEPIKSFLESELLSFHIGDMKFSAYLLTKATLTIIMLFWITGIFSHLGEGQIRKISGIKASNRILIAKALRCFIYFIGFMIGMDVLGIDLTALTIFSGAIGIGIGFGLQKITSNFISSIILLLEKSVEVDDLVELTDGTFGFIRHIRARYTLIETFDGKEIMIPNENFITNNVINWTFSNKKARCDIDIGVAYGSNIDQVMSILLGAAKAHPRALGDPAPSCFLTNFSESSIDFQLYFWVADITEGRMGPRSDVMREIWCEFEKHNISIPFAQRDIHIINKDEHEK